MVSPKGYGRFAAKLDKAVTLLPNYPTYVARREHTDDRIIFFQFTEPMERMLRVLGASGIRYVSWNDMVGISFGPSSSSYSRTSLEGTVAVGFDKNIHPDEEDDSADLAAFTSNEDIDSEAEFYSAGEWRDALYHFFDIDKVEGKSPRGQKSLSDF